MDRSFRVSKTSTGTTANNIINEMNGISVLNDLSMYINKFDSFMGCNNITEKDSGNNNVVDLIISVFNLIDSNTLNQFNFNFNNNENNNNITNF